MLSSYRVLDLTNELMGRVDLLDDVHLEDVSERRRRRVEIDAAIGEWTREREASRFVLSRTPARTPEAALVFGRDNRRILEGILGYDPDAIADLAARGVLS